jgi:hypothetical protein
MHGFTAFCEELQAAFKANPLFMLMAELTQRWSLEARRTVLG